MPWRTFYQGGLVLVAMWFLGMVCCLLDVIFDVRIPIKPISPAEQSVVHDLQYQLSRVEDSKLVPVFTGQWPQDRFYPKDAACHPQLGNKVFVAEKYSVYTLELDDPEVKPKRALVRCLSEVPSFLVGGIQSISIQCNRSTGCSAVLFGGDSLLHCPLPEAPGKLMKVHGQDWRAVTASDTAYWALRGQEFTRLGEREVRTGQKNRQVEFVPRSVSTIEPTRIKQTHIDNDMAFGLEEAGRLHAWSLLGRRLHVWQLPQTFRWSASCSLNGTMYLLGTPHSHGSMLQLWRFDFGSQL
jgi:hypothetical protein